MRSRAKAPPRPAGPFLAVAGPLFLVYLASLSPTVPLEDGGEMIRAAFTLGVTHPPGYPIYSLAGRIACLLPVGDIAFRLNLFSAALGAISCGIAAWAVFLLLSRFPGAVRNLLAGRSCAWWSAALGGWMLGLGPAVWWQSVIAEKYSLNLMLNSLIVAAIACCLARDRPAGKWSVLIGLALGVSFAHHGQTVYFVPAALLALGLAARGQRASRRGRTFVLAACAAVLGLSVKLLFPPIRAFQDPVHNWLDPSNLERYIYYISGGPYHYRILYWDLPGLLYRLRQHLGDFFPEQFSLPGVILGIGGAIWLIAKRPGQAAVWGAAWLTGVGYCLNFMLSGDAIRTYYMPVFLVSAVWISFGIAPVLASISRKGRNPVRGCLLLALAALGFLGMRHRLAADRSGHYFAYDFSSQLLRSVPRRCLLVTYEDRDLFPLWYQQDILGRRRGIVLVVANLKMGLADAAGLDVDAPERAAEVELVFPEDAAEFSSRLPYVESLREVDPGLPVCFSVVTGMVEDYPLVPSGAAYLLGTEGGTPEAPEIMAEWRRFRRWRTVRGVFSEGIRKDASTQIPISYYAYGDYRRGHLLMSRGKCREAVRLFRSALAWPYFKWRGPAAARASLGYCLLKLGDPAGAERELSEAVRLAPAWRPALRALAAFYHSRGRHAEALGLFERILSLDPDDARARRDLAAARRLASGSSAVGRK